MCYRTGKYTVCRQVCTSFSPEILQAGAAKGLIPSKSVRHTIGEPDGARATLTGVGDRSAFHLQTHHQLVHRVWSTGLSTTDQDYTGLTSQ